MTIPFSIDGARVVIPGVYDVLRVQSSIPAPVPAGRSILILGESTEGIPGDLLDLRLNFFEDFQSVKKFYGSGPIVDAARQIFSTQPNPVFGGSVQRLYVYKTNATTRASKTIASPAGYGTIFAAKYGESGNLIKSQIKAVSEVKPSKKFHYLPSADSVALAISVNGSRHLINLSNYDSPATVAAALGAISGLTVSGGQSKDVLVSSPTTSVVVSSNNDVLTLSKNGAFVPLAVDDVVVIPVNGALSGGLNENAGVYRVVSSTANALQIRKIKQWQALADAPWMNFDTTISPVSSVTSSDIMAWDAITVSVSAATPVGVGASLEIAAVGGSSLIGSLIADPLAEIPVLDQAGANAGSVSVIADAMSGTLSITLSGAKWATVPAAGDLAYIPYNSILAGATKGNVGHWMVVSASPTTMVLTPANLGLGVNPVVGGSIAGNVNMIKITPAFVSSHLAPKCMKSMAEKKVWIEATNVATGESFPSSLIGGTVYMEIGYFAPAVASATMSIDSKGVMTIVAGSNTITVRLNKYKTLQQLADFLNTQSGLKAKVANNLFKGLPTSVLDQVSSVGILAAFSGASGVCRLKGDYWSFKKFIDDNFGLIAFAPGPMALKAGLPDAETTPSFLSGAVVGGTTDASIQAGLDEGLKVDVRMVIPLFSRDSLDDIDDGLTDASSSYSIDAIHAAVKSHVAQASSIKARRERFGMLSIHDSFETCIEKCSGIGYERCQMTFMMARAVNGDGALTWFLPWMGAVVIAAGRAQAALGIPMLRKTFGLAGVKHIGKKSVFDDTLVQDFDPENRGHLERAIEAGLLVFREIPGIGIRLESPDLSTRSRENDPQGWVWERVNVLFTLDEVRQTVRSVLENYIGERQSDVSMAVVAESVRKTLAVFVNNGSLMEASVDQVKREGVGYRAFVRVVPAEALEFIALEVLAERAASE